MITNIAFACFSKKRIYSLVNALSQGYSLYQLSQLKWIRVDHTIKEGLSQLHWGLNQVKFSTHFMTYPSCMSNATHLQSTLKAIYDYHLQLLKNSSWTLWRGEKTVFTNYFYRAKFGHVPIPSCGCTLKPYPIETVISAWSRFYGSLTVKHWLQWI